MFVQFQHQTPTPAQQQAIEELRERAIDFAKAIHRFCPPGPVSEQAQLKIEEAAMWATKAAVSWHPEPVYRNETTKVESPQPPRPSFEHALSNLVAEYFG